MSSRLRWFAVALCALAAASVLTGRARELTQQSPSTGVAIEGTVIDAARTPQQNVTVTLTQANVVVARQVSNNAGKFRVDRIPAGSYVLTAAGPSIQTLTAGLVVTGRVARIAMPIVVLTKSGAVIGVVRDRGGAVIPGATVTLKHNATGVVQSAVSDRYGLYRLRTLEPGTYTLSVALTGFKTLTRTMVPVRVETDTTIDAVLEVGGMTDEVIVMGGTELIRTQSATVASSSSGEFVPPAPKVTRNALDFVTFLPGSETGSAARTSTIAGLPQNTINITIDGVNAGTAVQTSDGFFTLVTPRLDAVEEVSVTKAPGTETYAPINTNPFLFTSVDPLSTFAADVDSASYTNVRRFLSQGHLPPRDAVRVEELINYFKFSYPEPSAGQPVSITTELGDCPWAPGHKLALIGLRAKPIDDRGVRARNITLLLDVSGSMSPPERLPLIKTAMRMFVDTLRDDDRIAIVVYAGSTGVALPSTSGAHRQRIHDAIENLNAGGSTNGAAGLVLAYQVARENFIPGGINRVILATDGDFNVGVTSRTDLTTLIERERASGVFLSVLGVGSGNLKDQTMEMLADKGNGHYAYLDSLQEARRVLVKEGGATLETVAKDVKLQIEFNPAQIAAYRLIGYETRMLAARDFNDDRKDGGELGAGHTVTVLYEIVPAGGTLPTDLLTPGARAIVDPLRYQSTPALTPPARAGEWLTVKVRFKHPDAMTSELMERPMRSGGAAPHLAFASAVAEFGLLLRDGRPFTDQWASLERRIKTISTDVSALDRASFAELVDLAAGLKRLSNR